MKITHMAMLVALAGTTAAMAAPRESVTFTGINSNGRLGDAANAPVQNWAVAGSDIDGAYTAQFLRVTGTLADGPATANWSQEQQILVTPPTGNAFIVSMFTGTTFTGTISAANNAIPVGAFTTAGNWTFRFHESFDDGNTSTGTATGNAVDAIWNTVTFTLDDAAPAIPSVSGAGVTFTNVDVDGQLPTPGQTRTWVNANPLPAIPALLVRGAITGLRADPTNQVSNPWSQWRIRITPPNGAAAIVVGPGATTPSTLLLDGRVSIPNTVNPVGTWTFDFFEATGTTGTLTGTTVDVAGGPDQAWNQVGFELIDLTPSGVVPVAADTTGNWVSGSGNIASAGGVQWFSFTAPATLTATGYLDIDTFGTNLSPVNDTDIAMYLANGNLVDSDEDDSVNLLSQLSYGVGNRQRVGNGSNFSGQDGTIAAASTTGINPGGAYFVAVAGGNAAGHASVFNTAGGANTGPVTLRVRSINSGAVVESPSATPLSVTTDGLWSSANASIAGAGDIAWFTFTAPATLTATGYVDIDVAGTSLSPTNDTDIGLYLPTGALVDSDEDDGTDLLSQLSYGVGNRFRTGNGLNFSGVDGTIAAASTTGIAPGSVYFLAVAGGNIATQASTFNPSGTATNTGTVTARIRAINSGAVVEVPPATTISPVDGGVWASASSNITTAGEIAWFTFTTPADLVAAGAVDIDFTGTSLSPANDTDAGVYTNLGILVDGDEDDGTALLSQFSYGSGGRNATGDGQPFTGQDGTTAGGVGNLAASTQYYIAVAGGNLATQGSTFNPSSAGPNTGSVTARVRLWSATAPTDPATPPATFIERGLVGLRAGETESTFTFTSTPANLNTVDWFRFRTRADALAAGAFWLDIDTEGTNPTANVIGAVEDTEVGVYRDNGQLVANDDDDGSGWRTSLSFGQTTPARTAINSAPQTGALARNGRDGVLVAGTYWAAVSTNDTTYGSFFFGAAGPTGRSTTNTAARVVNWRTNLPGACTASDIAGPNGLGFDGELTADDIIAFIGAFTANNLAIADIAGSSGPGPDGELTADDIILFINRFTAGCL